MTTAVEMKAAVLAISGKDLDNATLKTAAELFNASFNDKWLVDANPYSAGTPEHAAWPGNATADEIAGFMAARTRDFWQRRVFSSKKKELSDANDAAENTGASDAAGVL